MSNPVSADTVEQRNQGGGAGGAPALGRLIPTSWYTASVSQSTMAAIEPRRNHYLRMAPLAVGERALGWFVLPPFQRPPAWSLAQQVRFVESCWVGLPIGVIVYNRASYASPYDNWLLDGQQRVTALLSYMSDGFPVFGHLFSELTIIDRRMWSMSVSLPLAEVKSEDPYQLRDIYDRLAYGGTPHEPKLANRDDTPPEAPV